MLLVSRLILSLSVIYAFYLIWTKDVNLIKWAKKTTEKVIPINEDKKERTIEARPHISIETDAIEYSTWTHQEESDNPEIMQHCDKITLYFWIHNASDYPAYNVDINATSEIIDEKKVGKFIPGELKTSYTHNKHLIVKNNSGRQPFILYLDKKATKYFKDGSIKVKLIIKVNYTDLSESNSYCFEGAYIYSPIFKNNAEELYSKESLESNKANSGDAKNRAAD